jgi:hypothetical protein
MQVSTHVKEAIDEVTLYSALEHKPDISEGFIQGGELADFESTLDSSFFNVFNQTCGYYQLKRFSATCDEAVKLSFIEDVTEYRLTEDPALRLMRWVDSFRLLAGTLGMLPPFKYSARTCRGASHSRPVHLVSLQRQGHP